MRVELGFAPTMSHRIAPEIAVVASAAWLGAASYWSLTLAQVSPQRLLELALVVGVRY
jgi:hypothetical protein